MAICQDKLDAMLDALQRHGEDSDEYREARQIYDLCIICDIDCKELSCRRVG